MLSIHPGRICPPMQSEHSVLLGVLSPLQNMEKLRCSNFLKVSNNIKINPQCCGQFIFMLWKGSRLWNINDLSSREHGGTEPTARRQTKVSRALQGFTSQTTTTLKTLIPNFPLTPQLWSDVNQQTRNLVRFTSEKYVCAYLVCVVYTQLQLRE